MEKLINWIQKTRKEKLVYKNYRKGVKALPKEYRIVLNEIQSYIWTFALDSDTIYIFNDILELFELGVKENKEVLDIVGDDVGAFCDEILETSNTWAKQRKNALNKNIHKKLEKK